MLIRQHIGITLVEALLVLTIGASIFIFGIKQYQVYRVDGDAQILKSNVDLIFQGMAGFYKANCYGRTDPTTGIVTPGKLNPNAIPTPAANVLIDIPTMLVNSGFLGTNLSSIVTINPIVGGSGGIDGYVAQFNKKTQRSRQVCLVPVNPANPVVGVTPATNCQTATTMATIVTWTAQVAVLLKDSSKAQAYLNLLKGDCLSSSSGGTVQPCGGGNGSGNYVVWERQPSFAATEISANLWQLNPTLQQFNQMYTTYPIGYLINDSTNAGKTPYGQTQYIFCGS